jgi:hypothetical protein
MMLPDEEPDWGDAEDDWLEVNVPPDWVEVDLDWLEATSSHLDWLEANELPEDEPVGGLHGLVSFIGA